MLPAPHAPASRHAPLDPHVQSQGPPAGAHSLWFGPHTPVHAPETHVTLVLHGAMEAS